MFDPRENLDPLATGDLIVVPLSCERRPGTLADVLDVAGHFNGFPGFETLEKGWNGERHYGAAAATAELWRCGGPERFAQCGYHHAVPHRDNISEKVETPHNSVCWRGPQFCYDPKTGKHDAPVRGCGHWGPDF